LNEKTALIELLLAGFFAVACIRAQVSSPSKHNQKTIADFFRLSGRLERLQRSRWQWFAMVAVMLVLRLQRQLPAAVEMIAAIEFVLFLALPTAAGQSSSRKGDTFRPLGKTKPEGCGFAR